MFVGHERERRLLHSVVTRLAAGHGAAVWLTGEPGIGKSTLVAAAMTAARQMRCHVFGAAAHQLGPRSSLRVLFDAFGVGPDTLRSADRVCEGPAGSTYAEIVGIAYGGLSGQVAVAADLVVRFVEQECAANPVLLVIEDALWADAASLDLLGRLAQAPLRLPFALLVTARPIPSRSEVDAARAVFAAAGAHVLRIAPLDEPDSLALARDLLGAVPGPILGRLVSGAGGNPRYLRDLAEALRAEPRLDIGGTVEVGTSDSLPPGLATAIGRRLTFLSEPTLGVLRIAAVLGPAFPANDLAAVTGHDDGELGRACAEALAAGVLVESPTGTLAFQHRLVQQALYQLLPASIRSALHHEAAEKLAHAGRSAELVARHLLVAPRVAATWELQWLADIAPVLSHLEPSLVIDLLERALDRLDAHDPRRVRAFADLASAKFLLGDNDAVVRLCPAILAQTQDPDLHARTACTLAHALSRLGRVDESLAVTQDALARPRLALRWSAQLRARRAMSLLAAGRPMQAQAAAERAKAEATDVDDGIALSHALFACALVEIHHRRRVVEGASMLERALMTLDGNQPGNVDLALLLTVELGDAMRLIGEPVEADRHFARALAVVERGTPPGQGIVRIRAALHAFNRGRWDEALRHVDAVVGLPLEAGYRDLIESVAAQVSLHRDDRNAFDARVSGVKSSATINPEVAVLAELNSVGLARVAERDGRPEEALSTMLGIVDPEGTHVFPIGAAAVQWLSDVVRLAQAVGRLDIGAAAARAADREVCLRPTPATRAAARHCRGLIEANPEEVRTAARLYESVGAPLLQAAALEDAAVLDADRGDAVIARVTYLAAVDIYRELGATWDVMRVDARLRPYNIRRGARGSRRRSALGWEAFTPAEERIAVLVAAGQSNATIATRLLLSRHTVESHVSHILRKLNATSRIEIAQAAARRHSEISHRHRPSVGFPLLDAAG